MAPHSSTLAWKIPWTEELGRLQSLGSLRVGHDWATSLWLHFHALEKEMATHSSVLAWRIPGTEEPGGLPSLGSHRVRHDSSDLAAAAAAAEASWDLHSKLARYYFCLLAINQNKQSDQVQSQRMGKYIPPTLRQWQGYCCKEWWIRANHLLYHCQWPVGNPGYYLLSVFVNNTWALILSTMFAEITLWFWTS